MIIDEVTLRKLNQLALVASRIHAGAIKGERRSTRRGSSVEFADYRSYAPGDDLRRLDWNLFARLERPFIKLLEEEEDLAVHILVDASQSMDCGAQDAHKFRYALRLAAAIAAIALASGDHLTLSLLSDQPSQPQYGPVRGQQHLLPLFSFLETRSSSGKTVLTSGITAYHRTNPRPGLVFLISDLLTPEDWLAALLLLLSRGHECILLHLLAPDEIEPPLAGDLRLVDSESGHGQDISLDAGLRQLYQRRMLAWREDIRQACYKKGVQYLFISTAHPWDQFVLLNLRQAGIVR
jgi:uncharacterized protein (DUF58 family)